jgi:preprotein translocase subunit SecE
MENIRLYLRESYDELINHVTWPTWPELFSSARLVDSFNNYHFIGSFPF